MTLHFAKPFYSLAVSPRLFFCPSLAQRRSLPFLLVGNWREPGRLRSLKGIAAREIPSVPLFNLC